MNHKGLKDSIKENNSFLIIGLDSDIEKIPKQLLEEPEPILTFNKAIIDATKKFCIGYKINTAFYEVHGSKGWDLLAATLEYIPSSHFTIADAKRGDIGNTSSMYAKTFFETYDFDAVTVAPYMGADSLSPFLAYTDKWTIVLGLTSNKGADDFQHLGIGTDNSLRLFEKVIETTTRWGSIDNLMFVAGATQGSYLRLVRNIVPDHFLLIPGIGTQGGTIEDIAKFALNKDCGVLANVSRAVIYASGDVNFASKAASVARDYQQKMEIYTNLLA